MKIELTRIPTDFKGETCFTHARAYVGEGGFGIMTTQPLRLSGSDIFYGMYLSKTYDGGKSWSPLTPSKTLVRQDIEGGYQMALCDATPMLHKKTGKIILIGQSALYLNDEHAPSPKKRYTVYSVYDEKTGDFGRLRKLDSPLLSGDEYFSSGNGSGQSLELPSGDILIPIYNMSREAAHDPWHSCYSAQIIRCAFDGESLTVLELGDSLTHNVPRGFCEPSVIKFADEFFVCLRNDESGYMAKSADGMHFDPPRELVWEGGEPIGNYNTQQHLIVGGGKLYLVYTRRGLNNDHVARHRAPLLIAEYDTERMCLIKDTEREVVPNRGARLGNFGTQSRDGMGDAFVVVSEWMQTTEPDPYDYKKCMSYGSDNSIFVAHLTDF